MSANVKSSNELKIVYQGATVSDLAVMFDMSANEINRRIVGKVAPCGVESKVPRYRVRDAAPYLCNVVFDPEEFIRNLSPAKLPAALQDAFWKGQLSRQKFEKDKGDLWSTRHVVETLAEVAKTIRMTVMMFLDTLDQETNLSDKQREIVRNLSDGLLRMLHKDLVEQFKDYVPPPDEHGRPMKEEDEPIMVIERSEEHFDDGFGDD